MSRSWASGFGELANRAREAVQEAADVVADAFEPRGAEPPPRAAPVVNIGFAEAPVRPAGDIRSGGGGGGGGGDGGEGNSDLLALWSNLPQPEPETEQLEMQLSQVPALRIEEEQRVFNVLIMPGILIERETRVYISASTLHGFYLAVADRLAIAEKFQIWQLDPLRGNETGELRLVDSLDCLADKVRIHLELSDEALSQRAIDAANAQVFDQIKADMASYMEGAGPTALFETWLKDSAWMKDTGGARDENGVPLRAAGSVVQDLWLQEAAWQEEKRKDQEALDAQSQSGDQATHQEADITFSLKVCRGGVHAGGAEEVVVRSPDHTVSGLVANICRRLKIPVDESEQLVLSIGDGDMCRVVRSLDQLPQSCAVQLWRAGSGPDAPDGRMSRSVLATAMTEQIHTIDGTAAGSSARLQSQLQLAVTHPDVRRAISTQPIEKYFPKEGSATTPPHEYDGFVFTTYMTDVFAQIRKAFDIDPQQFFVPMMSLHSIPNPGGKSGASFFTTADGSFFLKSVNRQEFAFLTKLLPELAHRLKIRSDIPAQLDAPRVDGDPTPGSSAWIKAQQKCNPVATHAEQIASASTKINFPGGTIPLSRLVEFEAAGKVDNDTPVYVDGMEEWLPLKQVRGVLLTALYEQDQTATHAQLAEPVPITHVGTDPEQQGANSVVATDDWGPHQGSLLPTFNALYSVRGLGSLGIGDSQRLVVMRNGLPPMSPRHKAPLTYIFDLKGSTRGRRASASERQAAGALSRVTLKDLDWRERFITPVVLHPKAHRRLLAMLHADVAMLETMSVVDYSLLLGVHMTSIEQSRLLPPPPSLLKVGQQTADVPTRASAEAAAFKANFDAMARELTDTDGGLQTLSTDGSSDPEIDWEQDTEDQWDSSAGCKWVSGRAVVRSQAEERLCHFEMSISIVDVLSSGASAVKTLEAFKNKAMYESAASVVPAPEYSSRFLQFATSQVFAKGSEKYGLLH